MYFYVFQLTEAEVDEKTLLGPTYRLVVNLHDPGQDGRWEAETPHDAIKQAAQGRDEIYAAVPSDAMAIERWPIGVAEMADS